MVSPVIGGAVEEIRADYAARYGSAVREAVEAGRVRDFLLAMDEPFDLGPGGMVPPLFVLTLGRTRRPQPSRGGSVNAGDEHDFLHAVYVGDTITTRRSIVDIVEKKGSRGVMYLIRTESTYTNQNDVRVALSRQSLLRWGL